MDVRSHLHSFDSDFQRTYFQEEKRTMNVSERAAIGAKRMKRTAEFVFLCKDSIRLELVELRKKKRI